MRASRIASAVFNATPQALVVTDADRCVEAGNPAFEELTGFSAQAIIGRPASVLKSRRHGDAFYAAIGEEIDTRRRWSGEVWSRRSDGSEYAVWLSITPVNDSQRRVTQFVGVRSDIIWRKQREAQVLHQATHDIRTGLASRRLLHERLTQRPGSQWLGIARARSGARVNAAAVVRDGTVGARRGRAGTWPRGPARAEPGGLVA